MDVEGQSSPIARPSVASGARPAPAPYSRRTWTVLGLVVGGLLLVVVAAGWVYKVPYIAMVPGSARPTEGAISVEGATTFPSEGELLYTTVKTRGPLSFWEYLWFKQRDDVEVVPEEVVLGDRDQSENRRYNLQLMDNSKQVAVAVALEELGYDITDPTGALIVTVVAGSAADGVIEAGDVIVGVEGREIADAMGLVDALSARQPGDRVELQVERHTTGEVIDVVVELGENPAGTPGGFLGVGPTTRVDFGELPFEVRIDTGSVVGPSAGLAFTLALLEDLTPGELTGGERVAVTGTIGVDGRVGRVGGVPQKAVAVRRAGIDVFLVPAEVGEDVIAEARELAGPGLQVLPVADVEEAIAALSALGGDVHSLAAGGTPTG